MSTSVSKGTPDVVEQRPAGGPRTLSNSIPKGTPDAIEQRPEGGPRTLLNSVPRGTPDAAGRCPEGGLRTLPNAKDSRQNSKDDSQQTEAIQKQLRDREQEVAVT